MFLLTSFRPSRAFCTTMRTFLYFCFQCRVCLSPVSVLAASLCCRGDFGRQKERDSSRGWSLLPPCDSDRGAFGLQIVPKGRDVHRRRAVVLPKIFIRDKPHQMGGGKGRVWWASQGATVVLCFFALFLFPLSLLSFSRSSVSYAPFLRVAPFFMTIH